MARLDLLCRRVRGSRDPDRQGIPGSKGGCSAQRMRRLWWKLVGRRCVGARLNVHPRWGEYTR